MVDGLVKRFGLDASRVVIVPGNHDLNWDYLKKLIRLSPSASCLRHYLRIDTSRLAMLERCFVTTRYIASDLQTSTHTSTAASTADRIIRWSMPTKLLFIERPEDRILFLGLNSCWQLDHHFRSRASIYMPALTRALDRLQDGKYDGWLKIAVWHHPVTGKEMMNDEFMQLLAVHGFQICLHGHIHEAIAGISSLRRPAPPSHHRRRHFRRAGQGAGHRHPAAIQSADVRSEHG